MRRIVLVGIIIALLQLMSPTAQAAPRLQCGDVVTKSTKLRADLTCASGPALRVVSDGRAIVLDLHGHTLSGSTGTGVWVDGPGASTGRVTVRHGRVTGFPTGIELSRSPGARVEDLTVTGPGKDSDQTVGVMVEETPEYLLDDVTITGFHLGLEVQVGDGGRVRSSTLSGNGTGVLLVPTVRTLTVRKSRITDNDWGFRLSQSAMTVLDSRVSHNQTGIQLFQSGATVRGTTISDNGTGVFGYSNDSNIALSDSTVRSNGVGVQLVGFGVRGTTNVIEDNTIKDNDGPGLVLDLVHSTREPAALEVTHNRFEGNGEVPTDVGVDGVADQGAAIRVAEDGGEVTVTKNRARRNAGTGIDAVAVVDGGGNTARDNDGPAQCIGVECGR